MSKFIFSLIYRNSSEEFIDNICINAKDKLDAMYKIKQEYPKASNYTLIKSE